MTEGHRASKGQRRIGAILREIPRVYEQLLETMQEFGPDFAEERFVVAAQSPDVHDRNRVTVIERKKFSLPPEQLSAARSSHLVSVQWVWGT